jgi:predicted mannosyl-3-phosphoglycerate phosphatase (HAD superfamily)
MKGKPILERLEAMIELVNDYATDRKIFFNDVRDAIPVEVLKYLKEIDERLKKLEKKGK